MRVEVQPARAAIAALVLAIAGLPATAAEASDPICAQRPGKSTASCTVAAGRWQVETGLADWSLRKDGGRRETALSIAATTLRFGLTDRSEIQLGLEPFEQVTSRAGGASSRASGFGDVQLAFKQRVTTAGGAVGVALMPAVKLPTAKRSLGNRKVEAALLVPVDVALGRSDLSLNLTPEIDWAADGDGRGHHAAMVQVASIGWQPAPRLTLSAELWRQWDWDPAGITRQASADAAIAYLASDEVQLDAGANVGLNRDTPDIEIYAGVAKRF